MRWQTALHLYLPQDTVFMIFWKIFKFQIVRPQVSFSFCHLKQFQAQKRCSHSWILFVASLHFNSLLLMQQQTVFTGSHFQKCPCGDLHYTIMSAFNAVPPQGFLFILSWNFKGVINSCHIFHSIQTFLQRWGKSTLKNSGSALPSTASHLSFLATHYPTGIGIQKWPINLFTCWHCHLDLDITKHVNMSWFVYVCSF